MMTTAVLFPGQGSQQVGMGADLFDRHPGMLGETAERILGWSLREICLDGPQERLTRTEYAQPSLFALAYATWTDVAPVLGPQVAAAAGHSLGEYTALTAAGMLGFEEALALVAERGAAMAEAADAEPSGMAALIGATPEVAEALAAANRADGGRLAVANLNAPGQVVVAGSAADLEWVQEHARDHGVRRAIPLDVAGAFHSEFMASATARLERAVDQVTINEGAFPVYGNVTARPMPAGEVADLLGRQVVSPVRFQETLEHMHADGVDVFVHVGPGDVTAGMARRVVPDATIHVVNDASGLEALSTMGDE